MATSTSFRKGRHMDPKENCAQADIEYLEQSHCSSNSVPSDASSSSVTQHAGLKASSGFSLRSRDGVAESKAREQTLRKTRKSYLDESLFKPSFTSKNRAKSKFETAVWTDEKHCSYLNSIEAAFIRNLYNKDHLAGEFSVGMALRLDGEDDGCVESRPRGIESASEKSETLGSWNGCSKRHAREELERHLIESKFASDLHNNESKSTLSGNEGNRMDQTQSGCCSDIHRSTLQDTKRRKVAPGQDILDLELRLGDFRTRLSNRFYTPTSG